MGLAAVNFLSFLTCPQPSWYHCSSLGVGSACLAPRSEAAEAPFPWQQLRGRMVVPSADAASSLIMPLEPVGLLCFALSQSL